MTNKINITKNRGEVKIFKLRDNSIDLVINIQDDTVWLTQDQMALLFQVQRPAITKHVNNIIKSGELQENQVCSILERTASDGKNYKSKFYNLDMIISVGYRVNSKEATSFRIWATNILKNHIIKGYSVNEKRLREKGLEELEGSINLIKKALKSGDISKDEALGLLDIITNYSSSWLLLQKFDEDDLIECGKTKKLSYELQAGEALDSINELKNNLLNKGEATDLFAKLRDKDGLKGIFGNIYQTFDKKELYKTTEEKAANLLYFIVKDHPFIDGNKRSGAFTFILFLSKNGLLIDGSGERKINDRALVAITLLIAESNPKDKDLMIKLLINLIN